MYFSDHTTVFFNGKWQQAEHANVGLYGQTLHYGIGAIEGMRSYETPLGPQIFKAKEHYERLLYSCKALNIPCNYRVDELVALSYELLDKNNLKNAYIRPLIYAGPNMGLQAATEANIFIAAWDWGPYLGSRLLRVVSSTFERPNPRSSVVDAKISGYYTNSIMAVNEAKAKGYDEALLNDMNGFVAEGPGANFFYEKDGVLYTCPKGHIYPGITRSTVMELAKDLDIPVIEKHFMAKDVEGADGAFFTGTAAEVVGLKSLNDVPFNKEWRQTHGHVLRHAYKSLVRTAEAHVIDVV